MKPHVRMLNLGDCVALILTLTCCVLGELQYGDFTNEFAVEIYGGKEVARAVAVEHGFNLIRKINNLDYYHFEHVGVTRRAKRSAGDVVRKLHEDPRVASAHQQILLRREKRRSIVYDKQKELPIRYVEDKTLYERHPPKHVSRSGIPGEMGSYFIDFCDTYYKDQWYLHNEGQTGGVPGFDVNVEVVWFQGYTGNGIVVTVLDDGCDHTHPDLVDNFDPEASTDLNNRNSKDPMPDTSNPSNSHGTRCAGEIAGKANNSNCGVGIAFNARFGCVRMLDGKVTDSLEAEAMSFNMDYIDIKSASWGPSDSGEAMEGPGPACKQALKEGAEKGRNGKGTIFVWATGNGGANDDMCGADGYVGDIHTLSIGCISDQGLSTYYTETCSASMGVIFTGGSHSPPGSDAYSNPKVKVVTTDLNGDCTLEFQGTSAAAPLAAGCFALVLEANPDLTWRDMQHLVVHTARIPSNKEKGWKLNGAGFHVNERFGFGAIDCGLMVELAQDWVTVGAQHVCEVRPENVEITIPPGGKVRQTLRTNACKSDPEHFINTLEHVQVHVSLTTEVRGAISIAVISPMGTKSQLLSYRSRDRSAAGIDFTFMSVLCWGEDPHGDWSLVVESNPSRKRDSIQSSLLKWSMTLYGTAETNSATNSDQTDTRGHMQKEPHQVDKSEIESIMAAEQESAETVDIDPKVRELLRSLGSDGKELEGLSADEIEFLTRLLREGDVRKVKQETGGLTEREQVRKEVEEDILHRSILGLKADTRPLREEVDNSDKRYKDYRHHANKKDFLQDLSHQKWRRKLDELTDAEIDTMARDLNDLLQYLEQKERK